MNTIKMDWDSLAPVAATTTPDHGFGAGGQWPEEGEHAAFVLGLSTTELEFVQKADGQKFPATGFRFSYQLCQDPERETPLKWDGCLMVIPNRVGDLTDEKSKRRAGISISQLQGHLGTILSREVGKDIKEALDEVEEKLDGDSQIAVTLAVQVDQYQGKEYHKEFLRTLLAN